MVESIHMHVTFDQSMIHHVRVGTWSDDRRRGATAIFAISPYMSFIGLRSKIASILGDYTGSDTQKMNTFDMLTVIFLISCRNLHFKITRTGCVSLLTFE